MGITVDRTNVLKGFDRLNDSARNAVADRLEKLSGDIENYMKNSAPWQDRTGDARRGLKAELKVDRKEGLFTIELSGSVDYMVYLEYAMERRFSILEPTMELFAPELVEILKGII